jgi:5-methylcytosine-specific restriction endonuclease McrA
MNLRVCSTCKNEFPETEFFKDKSRPDGLDPRCKACAAERNKKYRANNSEKLKLYKQQYHIKNRDEICKKLKERYYKYHETAMLQSKKYREEHREELRIKAINYRIENAEIIKTKQREYNKTPKGKLNDSRHGHKRRCLSKQTPCTLTLIQWEKIIESQGNKCAICGKRFCKSRPPTKDHIIPLSKGGGLTFENVQALCKSCNSSKQNKLDHSKLVTWIN